VEWNGAIGAILNPLNSMGIARRANFKHVLRLKMRERERGSWT